MITRDLLLNRVPKLVFWSFSKRNLAKSSQAPKPEPKHYRLWAIPGDSVHQKEILARQWTFKWHPGLNAGIDENRTIYALCDGVMVITEEKFNPDWTNPIVQKVYMVGKEKRAPEYARYIHVIPKKRISEFKLVDLV